MSTDRPGGSLEEYAHRRLIRWLRTGDRADQGSYPEADPDYLLFLVEKVVDCVDQRRSSKPKRGTGPMKTTIFLPADLEARLIWSEDPARMPHPDPWGF
ncbi:hypothetical protein [Streptomyces coelicoflavus]|uniref:hypothetical protein n=1 Tax=Streptomyces coelicoflavus TaxID=285562 RepID=UPI003644281D